MKGDSDGRSCRESQFALKSENGLVDSGLGGAIAYPAALSIISNTAYSGRKAREDTQAFRNSAFRRVFLSGFA